VKVAIAVPLGVKRNSGSRAKFPAIAIAVMLCAFHWLLVGRLCLVFFSLCRVDLVLFHPKSLTLCNVAHRSDILLASNTHYKFSWLLDIR
jgi:hypothetical protein